MESLCVGSFCLPSKSLSLQPFKCFCVFGNIGSLTIMMSSNYLVFDYDAIDNEIMQGGKWFFGNINIARIANAVQCHS